MFFLISDQSQKVLVDEKFEIHQFFLIILYFMISRIVIFSKISTIQQVVNERQISASLARERLRVCATHVRGTPAYQRRVDEHERDGWLFMNHV